MKQKFNQEIKSLLDRFLTEQSRPLYDNYFIGTVLNNKDTGKIGRVQVRVDGLYDGIDDNDLPWAVPDFHANGEFIVPLVGTKVNIYFRGGDIYFPHYNSEIIDENKLNSDRLTNYPDTIVIFDSRVGDSLVINRKTFEMVCRAASGFFTEIDKDGNYTIDNESTQTGNMDMKIKGAFKVDASSVQIPTGIVTPAAVQGFNCLPVDPFSGQLHGGTLLTRS